MAITVRQFHRRENGKLWHLLGDFGKLSNVLEKIGVKDVMVATIQEKDEKTNIWMLDTAYISIFNVSFEFDKNLKFTEIVDISEEVSGS